MTGASRGIGAATARLLEEEGARVLRVSRSGDFACDVTEPDAGERIVAECVERFGRVDVLVNNAGTSRAAPLEELTEDDWREQWELNVMAPLRLMSAAAPRMAEAGDGRIVNVASSSGKRPSPRNAAYSVTKAAELSLSRVFADRWAGTGVLVNAVAPGPGRDAAVARRRRAGRPERGAGRASRATRRSSRRRRRSRSAGWAPRTRSPR